MGCVFTFSIKTKRFSNDVGMNKCFRYWLQICWFLGIDKMFLIGLGIFGTTSSDSETDTTHTNINANTTTTNADVGLFTH